MKQGYGRMAALLLAGAATGLGCSSGGGSTAPAPPTSFRSDVAPILIAHCAGNGACHGTQGGSYVYLAAPVSEASDTIARLVGKQTVEPSGMPYVTAGDPTKSYLEFKMDGTFASLPGCDDGADGGPCGVAMPKSAAPLSSADQATIRSWILEGANDN